MRVLPSPWPPREPEPQPGPDHLKADIDWMSYPHRELYDMVHNELDLAGAEAVAAQWTKISGFLDRVGSELRAALAATADGWTGEGADRARDAAVKLVDWAGETGWRAENVANCVRRQTDIAETARRTMPEPPGVAPRPKEPAPPKRRPIPVSDSTQAMSASPAPSSSGFAAAGRIVAEPTDEISQDLHRQAADVMKRMQQNSGEVYENVPRFTSYGKQPQILKTPEEPEPEPKPEPRPEPETPPDDSTRSSGAEDVAPVPVREQVDAPRSPGASSGAVVPPSGPPGTYGGTQEQLGQGGRSGVGGFGPSGQPGQGAGAGSRAAAAGMGGFGGMPMGMAPQQGKQDEGDHKSPDYLVEDSDVWGLSGYVTPPVIGEDPRGGR
ncbi:PPE domain-containing protein [Amycolatopsis pittospori]|uniref:PPE domain-containing protein n=1 Tax=Amycolatopsis pittospori TaxID=2749434 RepID=UPI0015F07D40|nr:PPE domain-containing protein [Amycolatopsis pittospori]